MPLPQPIEQRPLSTPSESPFDQFRKVVFSYIAGTSDRQEINAIEPSFDDDLRLAVINIANSKGQRTFYCPVIKTIVEKTLGIILPDFSVHLLGERNGNYALHLRSLVALTSNGAPLVEGMTLGDINPILTDRQIHIQLEPLLHVSYFILAPSKSDLSSLYAHASMLDTQLHLTY